LILEATEQVGLQPTIPCAVEPFTPASLFLGPCSPAKISESLATWNAAPPRHSSSPSILRSP